MRMQATHRGRALRASPRWTCSTRDGAWRRPLIGPPSAAEKHPRPSRPRTPPPAGPGTLGSSEIRLREARPPPHLCLRTCPAQPKAKAMSRVLRIRLGLARRRRPWRRKARREAGFGLRAREGHGLAKAKARGRRAVSPSGRGRRPARLRPSPLPAASRRAAGRRRLQRAPCQPRSRAGLREAGSRPRAPG